MEGKIALIVGGSGGIGFETSRLLHEKGFKVCLSYFKNKNELEKKIKNQDLDFDCHKVDLNKEKDIQKFIRGVIKKNKKIDVVVYCVSAPVSLKRINEVNWEDFQEHINLQVKGFLNIVKIMYPMIKNEKKIKFITILTEYCIGKPPAMLSPYISAKYGLMGLTKCMASELARYNCTFNMISPSMTKTKLIADLPQILVDTNAYNNPLKRIAEPLDVAKVIAFLASSDSDYINGANIIVNGGNIFH